MAALLAQMPGPDGSPVQIRHAVVADARALLAYLRQVGGETAFLSFGAEGPPMTEDEERVYLARVAARDNALALLAEWNGQLVGCLTFSSGNRTRTRHIGEFGISVARVCWGIGLGRRLMQLLIDWAVAGAVVRKINLLVRCDNARAIALYESFGFSIEGRIRRELVVNGDFHDSFMMGRLIDPEVGAS
jgi:RimJ/RimL family protein N-acetyltransferase